MSDREAPAKSIATAERLILALDVPTPEAARALVESLGEQVAFYKVGLELWLAEGGRDLVEWLDARGKRVFLDLKLYDVPRTVAAAVAQVERMPVALTTVHGDTAILDAASGAARRVGILAVTVLTSLAAEDARGLDGADASSLVLARARRAVASGCAGVVCSGLEVAALRRELGHDFLAVVPGIRDRGAAADDQKRVVDLETAFGAGADHIVVGRPIRAAEDPAAAAAAYQARIAALF